MSLTLPGKSHALLLNPLFQVQCILFTNGFMLCCRWKKYEIHDIVIECAKVSLDPKEASCEEGYATMPEIFYPQVHLRPQDCTSSPYTDLHSSYGMKPRYNNMLNRAQMMLDLNVTDVDILEKVVI